MAFVERSEDVRRYWKYLNSLERERLIHAQALGIADDDGSRRAQPRVQREVTVMHPFKLYQLPNCLRATPGATDWRKFRVRARQVLGVNASGTDGADDDPDGEMFPDVTDILVPAATASYWFWLEIVDGAWALVHGATPATKGTVDGTESEDYAWVSFPVPDGENIPIGFVDTDTKAATSVALVRQLLRHDVVSVGGGNGAVTRFEIASVSGDYVTAVGGQKIAKPPELWFSEATYVEGGKTISYSNWDLPNQTRVADDGTNQVIEVVVRPYRAGNHIWATQANASGVFVNDVELTYVDLNRAGRHWAKKYA